MADALTYTYEWRAKEHSQVLRVLTKELLASGWYRAAKWVVVAVLVAGTAVAVLELVGGKAADAIGLVPWLLLVLFWMLLFARLGPWLQTRQFRRHDPNVSYPFVHTLTADGLHVATHTTETDLKWAGMEKVRETPSTFMFYYSKRCAYYLPKRAIGGPHDVETAREWIRAHLPGTAPFVTNGTAA
jgi:hypothetical protein